MGGMLILGICVASFLLYAVGAGVVLGYRDNKELTFGERDGISILAYTWPTSLPIVLILVIIANSSKLGTWLYNKATTKKSNLPNAKVVK